MSKTERIALRLSPEELANLEQAGRPVRHEQIQLPPNAHSRVSAQADPAGAVPGGHKGTAGHQREPGPNRLYSPGTGGHRRTGVFRHSAASVR